MRAKDACEIILGMEPKIFKEDYLLIGEPGEDGCVQIDLTGNLRHYIDSNFLCINNTFTHEELFAILHWLEYSMAVEKAKKKYFPNYKSQEIE